ncbi:MAG: hypothetical protein JW891_09385 [Candidatus Lokiarchaeota archaeon]|nr:hypothetical protein [Candidatus Lokiarchaeota archaeon]
MSIKKKSLKTKIILFLGILQIIFFSTMATIFSISIQSGNQTDLNVLTRTSEKLLWNNNGSVISIANYSQGGGGNVHKMISSETGGAIIAWVDARNTDDPYWDIYAQKIKSNGEVEWYQDGIPICTANDSQVYLQMISDGAGGAIIAWEDHRDFDTNGIDLYAQKIDANGDSQWLEDGIIVCDKIGSQRHIQLVSDGAGGAILVWSDGRDQAINQYNIYCQRLSSIGEKVWDSDGVPICCWPGNQMKPELVSDLNGGAIIAWQDNRSGNYDLYSQRINSTGEKLWDQFDVPICVAPEVQEYLAISEDDDGGAILTWRDERYDGEKGDIYAQKINSTGMVEWDYNGVLVAIRNGKIYSPQIINDGVGGSILVWNEYYDGEENIYAQKIDANGTLKWSNNGMDVCTEPNDQYNPSICSDGKEGVVITWNDVRRENNYDIYAQSIDSNGNSSWKSNGAEICTSIGHQTNPIIISDNAGGFIISWIDYRNSEIYSDLYAQKISFSEDSTQSGGAGEINNNLLSNEIIFFMLGALASAGIFITIAVVKKIISKKQ